MAWLFIQEKGYVFIRLLFSLINQIVWNDYEKVVHAGQAVITKIKIPSLYKNYSRYLDDLNIQTDIFDYHFKSPITFAAFESHFDSIRFWIELGCGGGCLKTIKPYSAVGNQRPRFQQLNINGDEHLINALGLPGPGIDEFLSKIKEHSFDYDIPIGLSVGGQSIDEYESVIAKAVPNLRKILNFPYIELNISCPNTNTGQVLHDSIEDIERLLKSIREIDSDIMVAIKVSPDAKDENLCDIASLASQIKNTTLNAGNTQFKKCEAVNLSENKISIGGGGLSGPSLFKRTLEMAKLFQQFKLPLIATGGISSVQQIIELQENGVSVVGMATALVKNPFSIVRLNKELAAKNKN